MKKLLATTALVSVMAAPVLAETKIAGSLETTFLIKKLQLLALKEAQVLL